VRPKILTSALNLHISLARELKRVASVIDSDIETDTDIEVFFCPNCLGAGYTSRLGKYVFFEDQDQGLPKKIREHDNDELEKTDRLRRCEYKAIL